MSSATNSVNMNTLTSDEVDATTSSSSDTESWTVLDHDEQIQEDNSLLEQKDHSEPDENLTEPSSSLRVSDMNIESVDRGLLSSVLSGVQPRLTFFSNSDVDAGPESLPSVTSDGIPIAEEYDDDNGQKLETTEPHYHWTSEEGLTLSQGSTAIETAEEAISLNSPTETVHIEESFNGEQEEEQGHSGSYEGVGNSHDESEDSDLDFEDDIEVISPIRDNDGTSKNYPTEELPADFAEATIKRGRTYSHTRNQNFNYWLSGLLVVVVALVIGLGIGHFLGWSERLELQEIYAGVREERLEELEEDLVNCITGDEGKGGDDQDLDDRVIHQLWHENKALKEQLALLTKVQDDTAAFSKIENELNVILRDRINDLLIANADLEKEVARLRYSSMASFAASEKDNKPEVLIEAKKNLNEMVNENEQLKIQIAKSRYSVPPVSEDLKIKLNDLQTENEELKRQIRKIRYFPLPSQEKNNPETANRDESYVRPDDSFDQTRTIYKHMENEAGKSFHGLNISPGSAMIAGSSLDDETLHFGNFPQQDEKSQHENEKRSGNFFTSFSSFLLNSTSSFLEKSSEMLLEFAPLQKAIDKINAKIKKVANESGEIHNSVKYLEDTLMEKWKKLQELLESDTIKESSKETRKQLESLSRTVAKTLDSFKDSILKNGSLKPSWTNAIDFMTEKWDRAFEKLKNSANDREAKMKKNNAKKMPKNKKAGKAEPLVSTNEEKLKKAENERKATKKKNSEKQMQRNKKARKADPLVSKIEKNTDATKKSDEKVEHSKWSSKNLESDQNSTEWVFERAKSRDRTRRNRRRSDWWFDRAESRRRLHELNTVESEDWYTKKGLTKHCTLDSQGNQRCDYIGDVNSAEGNRIHPKKEISERKSEEKIILEDLDDYDYDFDLPSPSRRAKIFEDQHESFFDFDDDDDEDSEDQDVFDFFMKPIRLAEKVIRQQATHKHHQETRRHHNSPLHHGNRRHHHHHHHHHHRGIRHHG